MIATTQRLIETIRQALDDHANPRRPDPGDVSCSYCAGAIAAINEVERRFIHLEDAHGILKERLNEDD